MRVVVVGGGLIGRACALSIADRGGKVTLVAQDKAGSASAAAAGILTAALDLPDGLDRELAARARDMYPSYLASLTERTGIDVPLNREGVLEIAETAAEAERLRAVAELHSGEWLDRRALAAAEPAVRSAGGAVLWEDDGAVDNVALLTALEAATDAHPRVSVVRAAAIELSAGDLITDRGQRIAGERYVIAAGAWAGEIRGARLATSVEPVRGQIVSFEAAALRRVVHVPQVYLVPRQNGCTLAGSTMERVGFSPVTTEAACNDLAAAATALCPTLASDPNPRAWAGLRPCTPDLLPLIGPDPESPAILYACGHSRNGVLLAPLTAQAITAAVFEESLTFSLARFRPDRFAGMIRA